MTWLPFALLAPALMTLVNFGDKYVVEKQVPDPRAVLIYLAIINIPISLVLWAITGFPLLPLDETLLLFLGGALTIWGNLFYFRALTLEETSLLIVLLQLTPIFALVLGFVFLGETLAGGQLAGFVLIILASVGVSWQGDGTSGRKLSVAFWLMVAACGVWALANVLTDSVLNTLVIDVNSLLISTAYVGAGYTLGGLTLYLFVSPVRVSFNKHIPTARVITFGAVLLLELVFLARQLAFFQALSLGPVALVTVLASVAVFYGIALGWLLMKVAPQIFREDTSQKNLARKIAWGALMIVGVVLLR